MQVAFRVLKERMLSRRASQIEEFAAPQVSQRFDGQAVEFAGARIFNDSAIEALGLELVEPGAKGE